jgi:polysaccharide chain length determinant protein (PEP-CTERM system associated)
MRDAGTDRAAAEDVRSPSLLDTVLAVWSRRKWLGVLVAAVPLAFGASLVAFLPNIYRSSATVLVDRQQVPEAFVRSTVTSALETRLHTISQDVLSRSRLEDLINRFGLYREMREATPLEIVVGRMRGDIRLELKSAELRGLREATVAFTISYQGSDPGTVAVVTNTLASFYIDENLKARERQATGTAEFLQAQLGETKKRLDDQEQRVSGFKRRHLGELPQQLDANLATLDRLQAQLRQNADSQTRAAERRQALSSQLAEAESFHSTPSAAAAIALGVPLAPTELSEPARLAQKLAKKKEELGQLRAQFSDKYPDVVQLAAEVAVLEQELASAQASTPKSAEGPTSSAPKPSAPVSPYVLRLKEALSETQAELKVLKAEESRLRDVTASYQARIEKVPRREQEFREISRDYESTRELYASLMKRYEEAQIAENMEQRQKGEQFRVLEPAVPHQRPAAPNRTRLLAMTLILSLGLAAGVIFLAEQIDTSFHKVDDLRAFSNVPVLVSIPRIVTSTDLHRQWWRMRLVATGAFIGLAIVVGLSYFVASGNEGLIFLLTRVAS